MGRLHACKINRHRASANEFESVRCMRKYTLYSGGEGLPIGWVYSMTQSYAINSMELFGMD